jgi:hypothetical protein
MKGIKSLAVTTGEEGGELAKPRYFVAACCAR